MRTDPAFSDLCGGLDLYGGFFISCACGFIGSWQFDYIDSNVSHEIKGEWHFSWVFEGMAIQAVIILPDYEYGTSLRIYNPNTHTWAVAYGYTGKTK